MIEQNSAALNPEVLGPDVLSDEELDVDVGPMHWTGRMEFDLSDAQGWRIGTVEIVIRIDHLSLWFGNRTLAVMDRDLFRDWLMDPEEPFGIDDVIWSMDEVGTLLTIDDSATYAIPNPVVQHLVQVV